MKRLGLVTVVLLLTITGFAQQPEPKTTTLICDGCGNSITFTDRTLLASGDVSVMSTWGRLSGRLWVERRHADEQGNKYLIIFQVDPVPATVNAQSHYPAIISVFLETAKGSTTIGAPFTGIYTERGCFEDESKALIEYATRSAIRRSRLVEPKEPK